jgi:hypothetical protein
MNYKLRRAVVGICAASILALVFILISKLFSSNSDNPPLVIDNSPSSPPNNPQPPLGTLDRSATIPKGSDTTLEALDRPPFLNSQLRKSDRLGTVVEKVIKYTADEKFPMQGLSITLIDMNTNEVSNFNGSTLRYPASVVKLFWLVAIYDKIAQQKINESSVKSEIKQMILKSDNQGASHILDIITDTHSRATALEKTEFNEWKEHRQTVNTFFNQQGYGDLNVSQKTFPIPQENIMSPAGPDQQLRGEDQTKPLRNKITTDQAAKLMYDIMTKQIVTNQQQKVTKLLTRDINPTYWKKQPPNPIEFNPVESFFGEGLSPIQWDDIISKAGWTTVSRQEVACIQSKDKKHRYILAVFGDDAAYGNSKKIFPSIASLVGQEMLKK